MIFAIESSKTNMVPEVFIHFEKPMNFRAEQLIYPIRDWVLARPSMAEVNKKISSMAQYILDEIEEIVQEARKQGRAFDQKALELEILDTLFFAVSTITNQNLVALENLKVDLPHLAYSLNGAGTHSNIFEVMSEIAANLATSKNLEKDIRTFLGYWFSLVRHSVITQSPDQILKQVIAKNSGNYPAEYFSGIDPLTQIELTPEECKQQFDHSRRMLRMIRVHCGLPPGGLQPEHHQSYAFLIFDFRHAEENQRKLRELLAFKDQVDRKIATYLLVDTTWRSLNPLRTKN